jgi:hypothetical protein
MAEVVVVEALTDLNFWELAGEMAKACGAERSGYGVVPNGSVLFGTRRLFMEAAVEVGRGNWLTGPKMETVLSMPDRSATRLMWPTQRAVPHVRVKRVHLEAVKRVAEEFSASHGVDVVIAAADSVSSQDW